MRIKPIPTAAGFSIWKIALAIAAIIILTILMSRVWPLGPDYYFYYRPVAEAFLSGQTRLYDSLEAGFYNAPWGLLITIPLTWFSLYMGQAVLVVASLLCLLAAVRLLQRDHALPVYAIALALANLHTFDLLLRGQIDAFILPGLVLGYMGIRQKRPLLLSFAFWLLAIKPVNVVLPALLFLYAIRQWPRRDQLLALSLPLLSVPLAGVFIGFDWPLRYVQAFAGRPPNDYLSISLWHMAEFLHLPAWPFVILAAAALAIFARTVRRQGFTERTLYTAIALNLIFTVYANGNHYILLIPVFLYVARHSRRWALLAYAMTWTPLLRAVGGFDLAWVDLLYPIVLLAALRQVNAAEADAARAALTEAAD